MRQKKLSETVIGIGPKIANGLEQLGITTEEELAKQDAEELYKRICQLEGFTPRLRLLDYLKRGIECAIYMPKG